MKIYTGTACGACDKYEVCLSLHISFRYHGGDFKGYQVHNVERFIDFYFHKMLVLFWNMTKWKGAILVVFYMQIILV